MKRICLLFYVVFLIAGAHLLAQATPDLEYSEAVSAFERGDDTAVIRILNPVVRSDALTEVELGRAWLVLGAAYHGETNYEAASHAYDMAIQFLGSDPHAAKDYAVAVRELGVLYREMGNFKAADRLQRRSLQIAESERDHAAISRACADLVETAMVRKRLRGAGRYVACAETESLLTNALDDDDRAHLAQVEGEVFLKTGATTRAIREYQYAIDLFTHRYGRNFVLTGWGYTLLSSAYLQAGCEDKALAAGRQGLAILGHTAGVHDPRYGAAELRYAEILEKAGQRAQARQIRGDGEATLQTAVESQCSGCTIDVATVR